MALVKEKEKNILILSMSTLHPNMDISHYYGEGAKGDYRFDGVSQLEAGTKYLLHSLADKGQKIHRIIVLNTCQTRGADAVKWDATRLAPYLYEAESLDATGFYEKRISDYLQFGDKIVDPEMYLRDAGVDEELAVSIRDYLASKITEFLNVKYSKAKEKIDSVKEDVLNAEFKKYVKNKNRIIKEECLSALDKYANNAGAESATLEDVIKNYEIQIANAAGATEKEKKAIFAFIREYIYTFLNTNDRFKHKKTDNRRALELLYPQVPDEFFKHISVEYKNADGKYVKDETMVKMLCDDLLELKGTAENLHVYIDSQGGERTFIHTVNAAIDLLSSRNVTIEEIIATDFNRDKLINKVRFVTKEYAITDLGAGMKAFLRYGKAEELLSYLDKKGLGESANEKKLIDVIKAIDESIQVADPVGLYDNLNELKTHPELLDETSYRDVNIQIVVEDIKRDYAQLLHEDSDIVDVIEWLCKKSLMVQTLTFIEDKIPEYLVEDKKIITLTHSYESETAATIANNWHKGGDFRLANGFIKGGSANLKQSDRNRFNQKVISILLKTYVMAHYEEIVSDIHFSDVWQDCMTYAMDREHCILSMPVELLFRKYNTFYGINMQYTTFCKKNKVKEYVTAGQLLEDNKKKDFTFGKVNRQVDELFNETVCNFVNNIPVKNERTLYKNYKEAAEAYIASKINFVYDDKERMAEQMVEVLFKPALISIKNNDVASQHAAVAEKIKLLDITNEKPFDKLLQTDEKIYYELLRLLIEDYYKTVIGGEFSVNDYIAEHDVDLEAHLLRLNEELSVHEISDEILIDKYIEYRDVAWDYEHGLRFNPQSDVYDNPNFYIEVLGEEFAQEYERTGMFFIEDGYVYQTVAGIRDAKQTGTLKLDSIYIDQAVDRRKLEKVLLFHKAIKNERNTTNHASERSVRLPIRVVKKVIKVYLERMRELK